VVSRLVRRPPRYSRVLCGSAGRPRSAAWRTVLAPAGRKLRELRFHLDSDAVRITYWIASGRRIILLTVFRKQRMRETAQVDRARRAMVRCIEEQHTVDEV
jgi:phage-related protein